MPANQTAKKKRYDMLTDHPGKALLFFALPMIFGNLFQQLYNITDSVIVGRFVGENALAAVGASYAITNVFIAIAIGGGIGSSVIISQFLGAGKIGKMKTAVFTTMINFLVISVILGTVGAVLTIRSFRGSTHRRTFFPTRPCIWPFISWDFRFCLCTMSRRPSSIPWGTPGGPCIC